MFLFRYPIGIIAFVQFIALSLLGFLNGVNSVVVTCRETNDCVSNLVVSFIFFLMTVVWFGVVWLLAYRVQETRSRRLAVLLIFIELMIIGVANINARGHTDALSLITSVTDIVLASWIILLAIRIGLAKGGRVVTNPRIRTRQRRR